MFKLELSKYEVDLIIESLGVQLMVEGVSDGEINDTGRRIDDLIGKLNEKISD